jgi:ATP-dependent exoDNAse (exonuclease V) beta subunit
MIGDSHQQIYGFRGAKDALTSPLIANATRLYLANTHRFSYHVSNAANSVLLIKGESKSLVGHCDPNRLDCLTHDLQPPFTMLCRSNVGIFL